MGVWEQVGMENPGGLQVGFEGDPTWHPRLGEIPENGLGEYWRQGIAQRLALSDPACDLSRA